MPLLQRSMPSISSLRRRCALMQQAQGSPVAAPVSQICYQWSAIVKSYKYCIGSLAAHVTPYYAGACPLVLIGRIHTLTAPVGAIMYHGLRK